MAGLVSVCIPRPYRCVVTPQKSTAQLERPVLWFEMECRERNVRNVSRRTDKMIQNGKIKLCSILGHH